VPPQLQTKVVQPMDSSSFVVKGAVAAGITDRCITHRVARRHFLIEMPQPFREHYHREEYRMRSALYMDTCEYTRQIIIRKEQKLMIGEPIKVSFFREIQPGPYKEIIYSCDSDYCPEYTNDPRE
jgi:hypothetical protein